VNAARVSAAVEASLAEHGFSGVVSIRRAGETLCERAAGLADRDGGGRNTMRTRFGIASGTKFLTALAVGRLVADGRLSFDTKAADVSGVRFPRHAPEITVRHLLTHTSGIPDYYDEETAGDFDTFALAIPPSELNGPRDYLPLFPDGEMKFPPGAMFSYSNGGYILLGVILEEVTGEPYARCVERMVLRPAGMSRSGFFRFDDLPEETALGYIETATGWKTNAGVLPVIGASDGGAYTTAADLHALWSAFFGGALLPRDLVDTFTRPFVRAEMEGKDLRYGHGLWVREPPDGPREIFITGCDAGVSFRSAVIPDRELEITVISNTTRGAWPVLEDLDRLFA